MNFSQITTQVGNFIQDDSSTRLVRIKDAVNRRYDEIALGSDFRELIKIFPSEITVNSGEANVYLPRYVDVVKKVVQDSDNQILRNFDPETFFERNGTILSSTTGPATEYTHAGTSAVKREISSAETLDFVSSDAGDTSITIQLWGLVGGDEINESVTLNGTTTVTTSNTFSRVTKIGTDATSFNSQRAGVITISGTTSTTEYATITPQDVDSRYENLRLFPSPQAGTTLSVTYKKRVATLVNDEDTLEIPIGPALVELAIADIFRQQRKWQGAQVHEGRGQKMLMDYMSRIYMQTEQTLQMVPSSGVVYGPERVVVRGS